MNNICTRCETPTPDEELEANSTLQYPDGLCDSCYDDQYNK